MKIFTTRCMENYLLLLGCIHEKIILKSKEKSKSSEYDQRIHLLAMDAVSSCHKEAEGSIISFKCKLLHSLIALGQFPENIDDIVTKLQGNRDETVQEFLKLNEHVLSERLKALAGKKS